MKNLSYIIVIFLNLLFFFGCNGQEKSKESHLGSNYFQYSITKNFGGHSYAQVFLVHGKNNNRKIISKHAGVGGGYKYKDFYWKVYGNNLVYVEDDPSDEQRTIKLKVYSPKSGFHILEDNYSSKYREVKASEEGILLVPWDKAGNESDYDNKIFYSFKQLADM
jgi:hypothetical protein